MKKTLSTAALSTVLVLGMAAGAMATHLTVANQTAVSSAGAAKITLDGSIRERGRIDKNSSTKDDSPNRYYDSRVRLGVKAQVSDQVTGYVQLVTAGDTATSDTTNWGNNNAAGLHTGGHMTGGMDITQAWINYNAGSWGVKVGHQPLALGNKIFFDHTGYGDDAIMAYTTIGGTHLAGILIKFDEGITKKGSADDLDGYVGIATHKFGDNLDGGINWTYLVGNDHAAAPGMSMSNVGINANYRQDNLSFMADAEFQFGDISINQEAKGWAVKLGANMDLGAAKVGLLYGYGSGNDNSDATKQDAYLNFLSDTNYDTIIAGYRAALPGSAVGTHSGLSNLSEYQLNVATKTTCPITGKDLSIMASATYLQLNEEAQAKNVYVSGSTGAKYNGTDSDVGTELDAVATWTLAPGLIYKVEAAYLFTGDAWNTNATNGNDPDNMYFLRHRLEFTF